MTTLNRSEQFDAIVSPLDILNEEQRKFIAEVQTELFNHFVSGDKVRARVAFARLNTIIPLLDKGYLVFKIETKDLTYLLTFVTPTEHFKTAIICAYNVGEWKNGEIGAARAGMITIGNGMSMTSQAAQTLEKRVAEIIKQTSAKNIRNKARMVYLIEELSGPLQPVGIVTHSTHQ